MGKKSREKQKMVGTEYTFIMVRLCMCVQGGPKIGTIFVRINFTN